jgi:hypothetical protein
MRLFLKPSTALSALFFAPIMAWTCTGKSNAELISNMLKREIFTSQRVGDVRDLKEWPFWGHGG